MTPVPPRPNHLGTVVLIAVLVGVSNPGESAGVNPLRPADTSSPRATLQGFVEILDESYLRLHELVNTYAASNRLYLSPAERQRQIAILSGALRASQSLDTSRLPPVLRDTLAAERALQLKEILDRIEFPAFKDVPDREAMARSSATRWRLPETEIDIVLIGDGPRAGEYLVSADTVDRLPEFYQRVRNLPYKAGPAKQLVHLLGAVSSGRTSTIYESFSSSPVGLASVVPTRWMLSLPGWARALVAGAAVWQWLGFLFGLFVGALFVFGSYRFARRLARRRESEAALGWHSLLTPLAITIVAGYLVPMLGMVLHISGTLREVIVVVGTIALFLSAAWLSLIGAGLVGEAIVRSEHLRRRSLDSQLIRLGMRFVGIVVAIGLLMQAASKLGFPAYSVLAGLGIGGLAVALAARDSLANLLGSMLIMFEKPFRLGHRIRVAGSEGVVEDVGFRSTRVRTAEKSLITIPNNTVVNATIENLSLQMMYRQRFLVQVTYGTSRPKLESLVLGIKQLLSDHPMTNKENIQVFFNDFGESSLNVLVSFYLVVPDAATELKEREEILLRVMDLAKEIGVEFAFPTRTLFVETMPTTARSGSVGAGALGAAGLSEENAGRRGRA
jgi:MscS family membrane protein